MARLKAPTSIGGIDINPLGANTGQALVYDGSIFKPGDVAPGGDLATVEYVDDGNDAQNAALIDYVDTAVAGAQGIPHSVQPAAPASPVDGHLWTNPSESALSSNPAYPRLLAIAQRTDTTGGTSEFSNVLPLTFTVPAGRRQKFSVAIPVFCTNVATFYVRINQTAPSSIMHQNSNWSTATGNMYIWASTFAYLALAAGTYTFSVSFGVTAGTVSVSSQSNNPWTFVVEDVGNV
jgi:hypothetical protein